MGGSRSCGRPNGHAGITPRPSRTRFAGRTRLFGVPLSRGGSVHTVLRAAARCEPVYEAIRQTVGQSAWVVPDETGWRVGGHPAWLHTLVGPEATAYVIDPTRSGAVAESILGLDYGGTMIHDGWSLTTSSRTPGTNSA